MDESVHVYTLTNKELAVVAAQALPLHMLHEQHKKKNYDSHAILNKFRAKWQAAKQDK
jgi:hypothetical protein